nr:MAG TPA: hypothetical protein [Caudoviricetes sp.]
MIVEKKRVKEKNLYYSLSRPLVNNFLTGQTSWRIS